MDTATLATIVTLALSILSTFVGAKYGQVKNKAVQSQTLINKIVEAWEDDEVTDEEMAGIIEAVKAMKKQN
jgi:hypothetical protein